MPSYWLMTAQRVRRAQWRPRLIALLVIAAITALTGGTIALIHAQGPETPGDPVFATLVESGMVEPLGHVLEDDGIAVTLDWVYADTSTLAAHLTITGLPPQPDDPSATGITPYVELRDLQGNMFLDSSGAITQVEDATIPTLSAELQYYPQALALHPDEAGNSVINDYFGTVYGDDLPERLPLTLVVTLAETSAQGGPMPALGSGTVQPLEGTEPFEFNVDVLLYPAITVQPDRTETASDLSVTLEEVTITPAQTTTRVCYDLPDGGDWHPVVALMVGEHSGMLRGARLTTLPDPSQVWRCEEQHFGIAVDNGAESLTLTVNALRTSVPDTRDYWEAVRDSLTEYGIVINVVLSGGRYFDLVSKPDDMSDQEFGNILYEVQQSLLPTVEGPWTFEVAIQ